MIDFLQGFAEMDRACVCVCVRRAGVGRAKVAVAATIQVAKKIVMRRLCGTKRDLLNCPLKFFQATLA